MKYVSTRGKTETKNFKDIVISGTADDGGLYVPNAIPVIKDEWQNLSYIELASEIISLFITDIDKQKIAHCCKMAYSSFSNNIAPITKLENNLYLLNLFQGPTLSFKDYALQFLGQIVDLVLAEKGLKKQIITATSGDTGPAAIYGFKNCKFVDIKVYYPKNGVSKFQENQMLSIKQNNIEVVGLDCSFDECQKLVKDAFKNDKTGNLMTVNSINIGRIIAQIVYYVWTYFRLEKQKINFFVPTGNFGNIFAGFLAKKMGVNSDLSICVNENDTLYRFWQTGIYEPKSVVATSSNAIDIANPSNFERILWYINQQKVNEYVGHKIYSVSADVLSEFKKIFTVYRVDQNSSTQTQKIALEKYGQNICPHTAIAMFPALNTKQNSVVVSTAHFSKFN